MSAKLHVRYLQGFWMAIALHLLCVSCIEPFIPEPQNNQSLLVVEGHISGRVEPYTVRLSRAQPLNSNGSSPESGARVSVVGRDDAAFDFTETVPGSYQSDPTCFIGLPGETYQLHIETTDGGEYRSEEVLLKATPPIDSVYFEREKRLTDFTGEELDGVKILIDTHDPKGKTGYYRYDWKETYQIRVLYPSQWGFQAGIGFVQVPFFDVCYDSGASTGIIVTTTAGLIEDRVAGLELNYINTIGYRLRSAYSVLVSQYALDEAGYTYWKQLEKSSENLGTLFDPTPYAIFGNIRNVGNPDANALGYFDASVVSEKRLYIKREQLDSLFFPNSLCLNKLDTVATPDDMLLRLSMGQRIVSIPGIGTGALIMGPPECCDCRLLGDVEAPDFWEN